MKTWLTLGLLLLTTAPLSARGVYQTPEAFLRQAFPDGPPTPKMLWLKRPVTQQLAKILGHPYRGLRLRYWGKKRRTAWILNEIGKEKPITIGVVVQAGRLRQVSILAFRESRGGEVRYPAFTDQFRGATLNGEQRLNKAIDGISGATLSVRAVEKTARVALFLHQLTPFADVSAQ